MPWNAQNLLSGWTLAQMHVVVRLEPVPDVDALLGQSLRQRVVLVRVSRCPEGSTHHWLR